MTYAADNVVTDFNISSEQIA